jgi:hypothetical protein
VTVSSRKIDGVTCFRGDTIVDVAVPALVGTVTDVENHERWSTVTRSELLGRSGETFDFFQYLALPSWTPAADRYWFSRGQVERMGARTVYHWHRIPNTERLAERSAMRAAKPSAVELAVTFGFWSFTPKDTGTVLQYALCADSGGSIPSSLQAIGSRASLPDQIVALVGAARVTR